MITYTFLALIVGFSIYCFNDRNAMNKYLFHPYSIYHNNEHYRFLTHAFIHGDYMHLAFNCLALYSFGLALEECYFGNPNVFENVKLGKLYYILLFTGGIYAASFTEYFRNKNNPDYSSLGASGAISSIMFCYIMISPLSQISLFFFPMQGWIAGILLLGVSYYLIRRKKTSSYSDNISHESHFWGALYGMAFILILKHEVLQNFINQILNAFD
ncbi:MAG: rhomboid family intramembrane serine protease [Bacteroidota bacterium]|nr:rhomboid family intramembrane serine protease [Bacteroidota bacterium]MDP3144891.1 rhomboid family intramembrane serine protease [Bacteroidota bacterium]